MDELSKRNMRKRGQRSELINTLYELIKNVCDRADCPLLRNLISQNRRRSLMWLLLPSILFLLLSLQSPLLSPFLFLWLLLPFPLLWSLLLSPFLLLLLSLLFPWFLILRFLLLPPPRMTISIIFLPLLWFLFPLPPRITISIILLPLLWFLLPLPPRMPESQSTSMMLLPLLWSLRPRAIAPRFGFRKSIWNSSSWDSLVMGSTPLYAILLLADFLGYWSWLHLWYSYYL